jgi:putative ABC transport system substrate-binding protein
MKGQPMQRRSFLTLLGGAAAAWPLAARAQQRAGPVIGVLSVHTPEVEGPYWAFFRDSLRRGGFVDGINVAIEYRYGSYQYEQMSALAADLVSRRVAVIAAGPATAAIAKAATATIPIVFVHGADPVRTGLVASLNRPGNNLTGISMLLPDLVAKRFGLLHDLVPTNHIGALLDSSSLNLSSQLEQLQEAARRLGVSIHNVTVESDRNLDAAFKTLVERNVGALFVGGGTYFFGARNQLVTLAAHHRIPAIYESREYVRGGGLATYTTSESDAFGKAGAYAARILKGEKPADLPVQLPTKFEFVLNLKTAKALGLTIPIDVLTIADEVIE